MRYNVKEEWCKNDVDSIFRRYETILRRYTRPANSGIVREVIENLKIEQGSSLEIGCGDGELYRLIPDFYDRLEILPTDISVYTCKLFKEQTGIDAMVVDARKLPFRDERFSAIIGYSVADVIPYKDYQELFEEIKRTLKPEGYFIHFLDLEPNIGNIIDRICVEYPDYYIFPWCDKIDVAYGCDVVGWVGLQLMKKDEFPEYFSSLDPRERPLIDLLAKDPFRTLTYLKHKGRTDIAYSISMDVSSFCKKRFDLVDYFKEKLRGIESYGFEIIKDETISATTSNPIDDSILINKVGMFYKIPDDRKEVYSTIHVFVGKKL